MENGRGGIADAERHRHAIAGVVAIRPPKGHHLVIDDSAHALPRFFSDGGNGRRGSPNCPQRPGKALRQGMATGLRQSECRSTLRL
jgi:hypothetical protein